ncbi:hypothetical protein [Deinococcus sp. UYEF24]
MRNALIDDLLKYHSERHEETEYVSDMPELAQALGATYQIAENSFMTPDGIINVAPEGGLRQRRALGAHEISHAITKEEDEEGGSYEKAIRYHQSSVGEDMDAHLESLANAGAAILLMPDHKVQFSLQEYGYTGQAVWELSVTAQTAWGDALQRVVSFDEEAKIGGLIINPEGRVAYVSRQRMRLPRWKDWETPDLDGLRDQGFSVFEIPGRSGWHICLKKVDDFEPA